jgi:hypothetical protein
VWCYRGDKREEIIKRRLLDDGFQDCTISRERKKARTTTMRALLSRNKRIKRKRKQDVRIDKRPNGLGDPSDII